MAKKDDDNWKHLYPGTIVLWSKSVWIVYEINANGLGLLSTSSSNVSAHPSLTWPDLKDGVRSVKWLADNMKEYIFDSIENSAFPNL